jgi:hypothetical protein
MVPIIRLKADETGLFSEAREARVTFRVGLAPHTKLTINMNNHAGSSGHVGRFIVTGSP